jgi:SSS family solute:Na+ symporter
LVFYKKHKQALQFIISALYSGYIVSNVLKWHWWRFNASGFFWGMLTGIAQPCYWPGKLM